MPTIACVTAELEKIAPLRLAADWDSVGLLVGSSSKRATIDRVMTCLSLTAAVAHEAICDKVDLILTHHPLPFRPLSRITAETASGRVLLELISAGIAVWSSHTAWDSAAGGINDQLAALLPLEQVAPIEPDSLNAAVGFGRAGEALPDCSVGDVARLIAQQLGVLGVMVAGDQRRPAGRIGIVCGSGGESVAAAARVGCTTFLTGEIKLHGCLEALASGLAVIAVGHHASERFSLPVLAERLSLALPALSCWASRSETDPLVWMAS